MTTIKVDTTVLDRIVKELPDRVERVGRKMAFRIEAKAKPHAPYMTGALMNSIYTVTQKEDGYSKASAAAKSKNPAVQTAPHPVPSGKVIANVGPCVDYAEYQEFGTQKMAAHPYLTPAVEEVTAEFTDPKNWEAIIA